MKKRFGFVSNSSTSSYILLGKDTKQIHEELINEFHELFSKKYLKLGLEFSGDKEKVLEEYVNHLIYSGDDLSYDDQFDTEILNRLSTLQDKLVVIEQFSYFYSEVLHSLRELISIPDIIILGIFLIDRDLAYTIFHNPKDQDDSDIRNKFFEKFTLRELSSDL